MTKFQSNAKHPYSIAVHLDWLVKNGYETLKGLTFQQSVSNIVGNGERFADYLRDKYFPQNPDYGTIVEGMNILQAVATNSLTAGETVAIENNCKGVRGGIYRDDSSFAVYVGKGSFVNIWTGSYRTSETGLVKIDQIIEGKKPQKN